LASPSKRLAIFLASLYSLHVVVDFNLQNDKSCDRNNRRVQPSKF